MRGYAGILETMRGYQSEFRKIAGYRSHSPFQASPDVSKLGPQKLEPKIFQGA